MNALHVIGRTTQREARKGNNADDDESVALTETNTEASQSEARRYNEEDDEESVTLTETNAAVASRSEARRYNDEDDESVALTESNAAAGESKMNEKTKQQSAPTGHANPLIVALLVLILVCFAGYQSVSSHELRGAPPADATSSSHAMTVQFTDGSSSTVRHELHTKERFVFASWGAPPAYLVLTPPPPAPSKLHLHLHLHRHDASPLPATGNDWWSLGGGSPPPSIAPRPPSSPRLEAVPHPPPAPHYWTVPTMAPCRPPAPPTPPPSLQPPPPPSPPPQPSPPPFVPPIRRLTARYRRSPWEAPWPTDGTLVDAGLLVHCFDSHEVRFLLLPSDSSERHHKRPLTTRERAHDGLSIVMAWDYPAWKTECGQYA